MKSAGNAPTPDPAIGQAALLQAKTGAEWMNFAKDAFKVSTDRQAELDTLTKQVTEMQLGVATDQAAWSKSDRQRYETQFKPIEDQFVAEASQYGSPERQAAAAATAQADVQAAAAAAKQSANREAASMGINPASGRFAGINRAGEMGTALAVAGAGNNARTQTRDKGLALKADVVNLGRGLPTQSAQAASLGLGAGSSAVGMNQGNQQIYNSSTGIMGQGFQGQMAGYQGQASTLQNQYNSQIDVWKTQQQMAAQSASGIGSFLGGITGLIFSDENAKKDKSPIADGAALDALNDMPIEEWTYNEGVADGGRHVGTYAQDFQKATGKGDGTSIPMQDAIGITMKAVQDLDRKLEKVVSAIGIGGGDKAKPATKPRQGMAVGLGVAA